MEIIKQLRRKTGINQSDLASAIGVSLRTIQLYEKKGANIPIKNLNKIADFFEMGIGELYLYEANEEASYYATKPFLKGNSLGYKLDNEKILLKAPLLLAELQGDFNGCDDSVLKKLPRVDFLLQSMDDTAYMVFEITGNAMDDGTSSSIPNGALVLGKKIDQKKLYSNEKWKNKTYVLVCNGKIICKSITGISEDKTSLTCHNINPSPEFKDFEIAMDDVLELYEVVKKQF